MLRTADDLHARFDALSELLATNRRLWETRPFVERRLGWEDTYPQLASWLRQRSHEEIDALESDSRALNSLDAPPELRAWHHAASKTVHLEPFDQSRLSALGAANLGHAIPARKWQQIQTFVETCANLFPQSVRSVIDWCAGKGHVARMFNLATGVQTIALEMRPDLCQCGVKLAQERNQEPCHFHCVDVLRESTDAYFEQAEAAVALHACGHLTDALFEQGIKHGLKALISVPCCYHHLGGETLYQARSKTAQKSQLNFTQANLRLATAHESVARLPVRVARRKEMAYRLGLDLLLREASGVDAYQQQGPFPKAILNLDFAAFCVAASQGLGAALPMRFDAKQAEAAGVERAREARGLSLVRACFRRPLELWLVLDRALRLVEAQRPVTVGLLCPTHVTPRNILVASCLS
jgi:hypothetical protein